MTTLLDSFRLGDLELPNRLVMAPLTRARATADGVPTPMMAEYYAQRATAGLLISEATNVSPLSNPFERAQDYLLLIRLKVGDLSPQLCTTQAGGFSRSFGTVVALALWAL